MLIYGCDLEKNKKSSIFGQLEQNERKVETFMDLRKRSCEKFGSFIVVLETWGNFGKLFKIVSFFCPFYLSFT